MTILRRDFLTYALGLTVAPQIPVQPVSPEHWIVCSICNKSVSNKILDTPDDSGWMPSYFTFDGVEVDEVICPECASRHAAHV